MDMSPCQIQNIAQRLAWCISQYFKKLPCTISLSAICIRELRFHSSLYAYKNKSKGKERSNGVKIILAPVNVLLGHNYILSAGLHLLMCMHVHVMKRVMEWPINGDLNLLNLPKSTQNWSWAIVLSSAIVTNEHKPYKQSDIILQSGVISLESVDI